MILLHSVAPAPLKLMSTAMAPDVGSWPTVAVLTSVASRFVVDLPVVARRIQGRVAELRRVVVTLLIGEERGARGVRRARDRGGEVEPRRRPDEVHRLRETDPGQLHENLVVALRLHRGLRDPERVHPLVDDRDGRLLRGGEAGAVRRSVAAVAVGGVVVTVADLDGQLGAALEVEPLVDIELSARGTTEQTSRSDRAADGPRSSGR